MQTQGFRPVMIAPDSVELQNAGGIPTLTIGAWTADEMWRGLRSAMDAGYTHALTSSTPLPPEQLRSLLNAAQANPQGLVVSRSARNDGARLARWLSVLLVRLESGIAVTETGGGPRVYPLGLLAALQGSIRRYGFDETEMLTRAGWAHCPVVEVALAVPTWGGRQRGAIRSALMHMRLLARAASPFPRHPRWPVQGALASPSQSLLRRLWDWISPARAWRQLRQDQVARTELAAGLAVGVFIANLPAYGFQSVLSLLAARRLHLHPLAVLLGSHISTPPIGPVMVAAAITLGHVLMHGSVPSLAELNPHDMGWSAVLGPLLVQWLVGSLILGAVMSAATFALASLLVRVPPISHDSGRNGRRS